MRLLALCLALGALWGCGIKGEPTAPAEAELPPLPSPSLTGTE